MSISTSSPSRRRCSIASATSSRGASSFTNRSPPAVTSLGDQEAVVLLAGPHERGGVELHELHVREACSHGVGQRHPHTGCAARVGGARPQSGRAAGGQHHGSREQRTRRSLRRLGQHAHAAAVVDPDGAGRGELEHLDLRMLRRQRGQVPRDAPPRGGTTRVCHAATRVAALEAQRQGAAAVGVEADAEPLQVVDAGGCVLA
jgi:hypothetical protein